ATTGNVVINEIDYNPNLDNSYNEWIEIYNNESFAIDMSGWTLCGDLLQGGYINHTDGNTYLDNPMIISANSYAVITDGSSGTDVYDNYNVDNGALAFHVDAASLCGGLENGGETVELNDSTNTYTTSVTYSDTWGADGNGRTLEKIDSASDDNTAVNWNESLVDLGTPGALNSVSTLPANQAPTITLTTPVTPLTLNVDDTQLFNATFTDAEGSNMTVTWIVDGIVNRTDVNVTSGSFRTFDYTSFDTEKTYNITVRAEDDSSNIVNYAWDIAVVDSTDDAPVVTLVSPNSSVIRTYTGDVNFDYTATDDNQVDNCTLYTDTTGVWTNDSSDDSTPFDNFTLTDLSSGNYIWNVECFDNNSASSFAPANFTFEVERVGMVDGHVTDSDGNNVSGAIVEIKQGAVTVNATVADANGTYSLWADEGSYDVLVYSPGLNQNQTDNVSVTSGQITVVDAVLEIPTSITGNLSGKVSDANNNIFNALVELRLGASTIYSTKTNETGDYEFAGINQSTYTLRITKSGFDSAIAIVDIAAGNSTVQNVTLTPGVNSGKILGAVFNATTGLTRVADSNIVVYETGTTNVVQILNADVNGDYIVNGLVTSIAYDIDTGAAYIARPENVILAPGSTSSGNDIVVN
ncbi:MAG: carboxypeptidase regulatory-like domain-containing protein, partial [Nanoarchaeota archaeon]|nr:carboxypeptidase regulatory-like domain-containing protein [Nanoarchaeota archaeon]